MAYTSDTQVLLDQLRTQIGDLTDQRARQLVQAWVYAWDVLSVEFDAAVQALAAEAADGRWPSRAKIARSERTRRALEQALNRLQALADQAAVDIAADAGAAALAGADAQLGVIASQLPGNAAAVGVGFHRAPVDALDAIVLRARDRIVSSLRPLSAEATARMKSALIRGVAVGENPRTTAASMLRGLESGFNGGLTRALTISRTEILDAYRTGAKASHDANTDVLTEWRWLCDFSPRTCPACLAMNGTRHPLDEAGPEGHPNCRCARVPVTKSWKSLGIDLEEPGDVFPDARAWFDQLPAAEQVQIMGPARLAALRSGQASWEQLATKRSNAEWRDSWQTTPVTALTA